MQLLQVDSPTRPLRTDLTKTSKSSLVEQIFFVCQLRRLKSHKCI